MNDDALADRLRACVGAPHVTPGGHAPAHEHDARGRYRGRARFIVKPGSTQEVAAVVRCCHEAHVPLVPQGGNTGLVGAGVPDNSGQHVLLSLVRLNRIRHIDAPNLSLTAEAGCTLQAVQQAAQTHGLLFPLSLASEGSCTLGGNLATNAGGTQVLRYGNARELCLGLEVVTAQGDIWHGLSALRKDNTGYALRDVFIGSEGTLGVITAATMRLFPAPASVFTGWVTLPNLEAVLPLLALARQRWDAGLTAFELINGTALTLVQQHLPHVAQPLPATAWQVLWELSSPQAEADLRPTVETFLADALAAGWITNAALAHTHTQAAGMWQLREAISPAQRAQGLNIKHDVSLPTSAIPTFIQHMQEELAARIPGVMLVTFGHVGDGNLHYNVQAPAGDDPAGFLARWEGEVTARVHDRVMVLGGSFSAEHGIGALKRDELARRKDPVALAMMRAIKQALDPAGLMNPERLL